MLTPLIIQRSMSTEPDWLQELFLRILFFWVPDAARDPWLDEHLD